jgi:hypothetical protein
MRAGPFFLMPRERRGWRGHPKEFGERERETGSEAAAGERARPRCSGPTVNLAHCTASTVHICTSLLLHIYHHRYSHVEHYSTVLRDPQRTPFFINNTTPFECKHSCCVTGRWALGMVSLSGCLVSLRLQARGRRPGPFSALRSH